MLPAFEIVARHRPIALVGRPGAALVAPFAAVEADLDLTGAGEGAGAELALTHPDGTRLAVRLDGQRASLRVGERPLRSRRHGRTRATPSRLGLTLTGSHLAVLTREDGAWVVRGRVDLREVGGPDTRAAGWAGGLRGSGSGAVTGVRTGPFGQLGLRDVRLVSHADGTPYRRGGEVLLTATSAGPGFFDTAHTSLWALTADDRVEHRADLFFGRPDRPGVYGDHATHLLRDGDRWLVATSTWSDFPADRHARVPGVLRVTLAESSADLTSGQHVLPTRELALPAPECTPSVGTWDPHLVRDPATGEWLVGYVSARRFFDFHPALASGPTLDDLTLRGAATDRRATEGTTLLRDGATWRVLASDGRDNRRATRARFPVFDTSLREVGTLRAPYPTNIPWPSVVPPDPAVPGDEWRWVTFNGRPAGGTLAGYGTHGDVVVMRQQR
ncbi:hypothetical protein GUY44_00410 [Pimelobacter simplex]|uniref:Uncharacterized protein n=1 Tax=Nocardioides simplex TaxID=2045 RepID=A0A0C5XD31_NOCSI|nr:hypothetical protein [Pimelobacter simplex]AJR18724.1 hypothetical protein KR76_23285 [Pimelobacter simplex]MCG8148919.1 hypothetical protein [Pimelobacter simplex]GEB14734.1 hypothetical protein NSI01_30490 [Pimelobacter simplex]SFM26132.1 hypothetical protein SAMN05421671_0681 [Pimelobacter simplex]